MVDRVTQLREMIAQNNGELIPLSRTSCFGEVYNLVVRRGQFGEEKRHLVLVEMFAQGPGILVPVGHYDWTIRDGLAGGYPNMHEHINAQTSLDRLAYRFTEDALTFCVGEHYQKNNVGSFMIVAAALGIDVEGIVQMSSGNLTDDGLKAWARFDIGEKQTFPPSYIISHPRAQTIVSEFYNGIIILNESN